MFLFMASSAQRKLSPSGGVIEDNKNNKMWNFNVADYPFYLLLRITFVLNFMSSKLALEPESTFLLINTSFRIQLYEEALGDG